MRACACVRAFVAGMRGPVGGRRAGPPCGCPYRPRDGILPLFHGQRPISESENESEQGNRENIEKLMLLNLLMIKVP